MNFGLSLIVAIALPFTLLVGCAAQQPEEATQNPDAETTEIVRHVVVFNFKDDTAPEQIQQLNDAFFALEDKIPGIVSFEHGTNNSPEGLNKGFTHVYLMTFEDEDARDTYLPHPDHEEFVALLDELDILEDVFVVDYTPGQ